MSTAIANAAYSIQRHLQAEDYFDHLLQFFLGNKTFVMFLPCRLPRITQCLQ